MNAPMRAVVQKHGYVRSKRWMNWVRSLPSCVSGKPAEEVHHIKGLSHLTGSGGSIKGDDLFVIPLTRAEHMEGDAIGWDSWEAKHGLQIYHWANVMRQAVRDGVVKLP